MGQKIILYHNARCSKSRAAYAILEEKGVDFKVVNYLDTPLAKDELRDLFHKLNIDMADFVRTNETDYVEYVKNNSLDDHEALFAFMEKHPKLLQRPIVVCGNKAVIGRPSENILRIV